MSSEQGWDNFANLLSKPLSSEELKHLEERNVNRALLHAFKKTGDIKISDKLMDNIRKKYFLDEEGNESE